ncbi:MAG: alpha/beta hydrolase [Actinomycetota bacterium]|nr:alpha/beta hydrolase [Actinomycetota bacterium]
MTSVVAGMHMHRTGAGGPMLLLHGIGHRWQMWTPLLDSLSRDFDVVAVDLPGFGMSPRFPEDAEITLAAAVDRLEACMDELGWRKAHLVGNSLGGWLALELAKRGRAMSICALAPAGLWDPDRIERRLRFWFTIWLGGSRHLQAFSGLLRFRLVRIVVLARLFGRPARVPPEVAIGDVENFAKSALEETLAAGRGLRFFGGQTIAEPITVAWASRDPLFGPRRCTLEELPDHTRAVMLRGCGHVPTWDDPQLILQTIRATVARARPTGPGGGP